MHFEGRELACYPERRFAAVLWLLCRLIYHNLFTACIGGKEKKKATHKNKADTLTKMSSKTVVTPGAL